LVVVFVGVSHPFVFGAVATQSPQPALQVYEHVVPLQLGAPCVVSHALLQPPQLLMVFVGVSQPLRSGAAVLQLPNPALQLA
jgi:hypothetical protein